MLFAVTGVVLSALGLPGRVGMPIVGAVVIISIIAMRLKEKELIEKFSKNPPKES